MMMLTANDLHTIAEKARQAAIARRKSRAKNRQRLEDSVRNCANLLIFAAKLAA